MNVTEYLKEVAYIGSVENLEYPVYKSKYDDSYIIHVGMEEKIKYLADREITQKLKHGTGFSSKDGKWYGWSHRAIYGFKIGSECKKGDCHYTAGTPEELIDDHADFFADISKECSDEKRAECQILEDRSGIRILHTPISLPVVHSIEDLPEAIDNPEGLKEGFLFKDSFTIIKCSRGEWVAKTMEDAKQMAIDFNEGVS